MLAEQVIRTTRNRADVRAGKRDWFRFEAKAGDAVDVHIYDEISWFGITAQDFTRELNALPASTKTINLHLNSPGGDVFDGITIYNALKAHPAAVNVSVDGIAASIASVIAMAGNTVTMSNGSMMMIHEPYAMVLGNAVDMRKQADALDLMGNSIASIYQARAGDSLDFWRGQMAAETWYSDKQAVDAGLADGVSSATAADASFDLSIFRNGPTARRDEPVREEETPAAPVADWRIEARRRVAAAQLEVIHGYGH